jgi:hypothetical protein
MKFKTAMSAVGNGLLTLTSEAHDAPIRTKIEDLDRLIEKLREEKADLQDKLIDKS